MKLVVVVSIAFSLIKFAGVYLFVEQQEMFERLTFLEADYRLANKSCYVTCDQLKIEVMKLQQYCVRK